MVQQNSRGGKALEDQHFRHCVDDRGKHTFFCISGPHKPRAYASFKTFQTHMFVRHNLNLPSTLLELGLPWLRSKSDLSGHVNRKQKQGRAAAVNKIDQNSWERLRGTVRLRWKQCKGRKKTQLKQKYQFALENEPEPAIPKKSILVRLIKVAHILPHDKNGWCSLGDDCFYEMTNEFVQSADNTCIVSAWIRKIRDLPVTLPRDRKLQALKNDCALLELVFPKLDVAVQSSMFLQSHDVRQVIISEALLYLSKQRALHLWKLSPKETDFEAAYEDYTSWKRNQKPQTIAVSVDNLIKDYKRKGCTARDARKQAGVNEVWMDTSDESDYEPGPQKWGLKTHESDQGDSEQEDVIAESRSPESAGTAPVEATPVSAAAAEPEPDEAAATEAPVAETALVVAAVAVAAAAIAAAAEVHLPRAEASEPEPVELGSNHGSPFMNRTNGGQDAATVQRIIDLYSLDESPEDTGDCPTTAPVQPKIPKNKRKITKSTRALNILPIMAVDPISNVVILSPEDDEAAFCDSRPPRRRASHQ